MGPERVRAEEVRRRQQAGDPLLLVSAYPRTAYERLHLCGATALEDFERAAPSMGKGHVIVFYCG